ncbi:MAG: amidohydrolase family protein [Clostridia bacterium]|nr:amidohydrolase family protein [Clostridia bacterium]
MKPLIKSKYVEEFEANGRLTSINVIDTHTHMGAIAGVSSPICEMEDCLAYLEKKAVKQIWCTPDADYHCPMNFNSEIQSYMKKYPGKVLGYYAFNPNYEQDYIDRIGMVLENDSFIGVKVLPEYHGNKLDGKNYVRCLEFANEHNLIFLSHTWGGSPCNSPDNVAKILPKYRNLQFVMGHSAPGALDDAIELVKTYDNVYLDICDIHRNSGIIEKMCREVGSEKVIFGTDMPWYDPSYAIGSVIYADITDNDRENIFYKNAERMIGAIRKKRG